MTLTSHAFDAISIDQLRDEASAKWTMFPDCIGAWVAEMDFGTSPAVQEALHELVHAGYFGYLTSAQTDPMAAACAGWFARHTGYHFKPEWIHALPDVVRGFDIAIEHFSPRGSKIIVPTPAYMPFLVVPGHQSREVIEVPCPVVDGRFVFDYDGIDRAFQEGGGLLVVCNPFNPLGRVLEEDELRPLVEIVERHNGRVFSDEIHAPLRFRNKPHIPYASLGEAAEKHSLTTASASKAWNLAGLKCAQLIFTNDADEAYWQSLGYFVGRGAALPGVVANTAAWNDGDAWLDEVLDYLDGNRALFGELLATHLPEAGYVPPEGTYLAWIDLRAYNLEGPLDAYFRDHAKVALVDGAHCGLAGQGHVRFNIATTRAILEEAVERMGKAVRQP